MGKFVFPPNRKAMAATLEEQAHKVLEEAKEVVAALEENDMSVICETLDTIQACEGILRKYSEAYVDEARTLVKNKCKLRGDYE